ncbi:PLP-dependent aminotransferase family protein [Stappia sp.]|uniref:MocR-like pyridoxine biosynthesis transcription factor PdxR n=1 Tax=Stappia sp. TaxID=1870903 RepID=UPI003C7DA633
METAGLSLSRDSAVPLSEQIYRGLRAAIGDGRLPAGGKLPSSRRLAAALDVSRNTVTAAYELLVAEGVVTVRSGTAPRIAETLPQPPAAVPETPQPARSALSQRGQRAAANPWAATRRIAGGRLEPGTPALDCFPRDAWGRCLRRAARTIPSAGLFYDQPSGLIVLKEVLARYLAAERGVRARADTILITPSTQASLSLLATCLADPGDTVWLEDPGYLGARAAFDTAGLRIAAMPVDDHGADVSAMAASALPPRLIYVTPSHQYPMGARMPLPRRLALLETARRAGAVVLEDDYDSEFLFEGRPVAALQGLAEGAEAIYLGTFAKSMIPGLRLAYMVVPQPLAAPLSAAQRAAGLYAGAIPQAALADFIDGGHYRAHLKRIRALYQTRGRYLAGALRAALGNRVQVADPVGGVQLAARFAPSVDDRRLADAVNADGFGVAALSAYALDADARGLVIGFASATQADAAACVAAVAAALDAQRSG